FIPMKMIGSATRQLMQCEMPSWRPSAIAQKIPILAPDLDVSHCLGNCMEEPLPSRIPCPEKSYRRVPPWIVGGLPMMNFVAESQRHIDDWLAKCLVSFPLI